MRVHSRQEHASLLHVVEPRLTVKQVVVCVPVFQGSQVIIYDQIVERASFEKQTKNSWTLQQCALNASIRVSVLFCDRYTTACSSAGHCCACRSCWLSIFNLDKSKAQLCPGFPVFPI